MQLFNPISILHLKSEQLHLGYVSAHTRELKYLELQNDHFVAAMKDTSTGLTRAALLGQRKQSVKDAERLLSYPLANYFASKGWTTEAEYISTIAGWHDATDGRGISQSERSKKNYKFLRMMLKDWMPWLSDSPDLQTIDVNRLVTIIHSTFWNTFKKFLNNSK